MAKLLKHYWVDRDNPQVFAVSPQQWSTPMFGVVSFNLDGLNVVHSLDDENGIQYFLSTCPDETVIEETTGLAVLTQQQWDDEISAYDARQGAKRLGCVRKYRNELLSQTDWIVIKSLEQGVNISTEFKDWRQSLRDLPESATFPTELPSAPVGISVDQSIYNAYVADITTIPMINDPLV